MAKMRHSLDRRQETEHIVAFLDLLGASEIIAGKNETRKSEDVLNNIAELFSYAELGFGQVEDAQSELRNLKCATFSDNIVFALDLSKMPKDKIAPTVKDFLITITFFQSVALEYHLLFRGGISLGSLYMDSNENFLWGKALVDAHHLEERVAIYPRIVLSRQFEKKKFDLSQLPVCMDFDGIYFLDYMPTTIKLHPDWVENATNLIEQEYSKASPAEENKEWGHERILQKYDWLKRYISRSRPI